MHNHKDEHCEGVAGLVFANGRRSFVTEELPDLHAKAVNDDDYGRYADLTRDDKAIVRKENYRARVIGGLTIYADNGERWGALIFDSPDPSAVTQDTLNLEFTKRTLSALSALLSRKQA